MKIVTFSPDTHEKLKKGIDLLANAVKVTLGPRGRNVVYGNWYGFPKITKDGVTVAKIVDAKDTIEQMGVLLMRQVAQKTADDAGDGTTTATLLAQEIYTQGLRALGTGANPILIKRYIDKYIYILLGLVERVSEPVGEIEDRIIEVATLSANNDKVIGELINSAIKQVGNTGVVTIEDNYQDDRTYIDMVEGMKLHEGLMAQVFVTDQVKMEAVLPNALLLIVDADIHSVGQIKGVLEKAFATGRPVCLMANAIHQMVLSGLAVSKIKNNLPIIAVKSPYFGDFRTEVLNDIAVLTGATVLGPSTGLRPEDAGMEHLGDCEMIRADRYSTTILGGRGNEAAISGRIQQIQELIAKTESDYEKEKLQERLSKLTTGVAVIKVGAPTEVEQQEKKMRIEDSLLATRAAIEGGIVPGGGATLLRLAEELTCPANATEEERIGFRIVCSAMRAPIKQIAQNAGLDGAEIIAYCLNGGDLNFGYNFLTNEYGNLLEMGVIDPTKVVKATITNAASVAGMLLTTEVVCAEEEDQEPPLPKTPRPRSA